MLTFLRPDPCQRTIEVRILDEERVVLRWEVDRRLCELEKDAAVELEIREGAPRRGVVSFEESTVEGGGLVATLRRDDGVVETSSHL